MKYPVKFSVSFLLVLLAISAFAQSKTNPTKPAKPNIIFILGDDMGWGDVGAVSYTHLDVYKRQGYFVTAALFLPKNIAGKSPAILYCSGHSANGFRSDVYQHTCLLYTSRCV